MAHHSSNPKFLLALFKGSMTIAGFTAGCISVLHILYGLGWFLHSVVPKHEAHTLGIYGIEAVYPCVTTAPTSVWLFAADSQPILVLVGILIVSVTACLVHLVIGIATIGGWQKSRMEPFRKWMNT